VQSVVESQTHPTLVAQPAPGRLVVEAHAVPFRDGAPAYGIVVGRLDDGRRCLAHAVDESGCAAMLHDDCIGRSGEVTAGDPVNTFRFD